MSLLRKSLIFCAISLCSLARGNEPFPFIDKASQQARDADRRAILAAELAAEQQALGPAHESMVKAPTEDTQAELHRHEENVKALRRELIQLPDEKPLRVHARAVGTDVNVDHKRTSSTPPPAPFWDVYRRGASTIDSQPPAKELP
ncbi:hypothetical protein [Massilia sp. Root1485]|uniref:hypothetical protein n=1 Tax=Massilia sp. Root1485 TaxID=1736472 RepID=UPI000B0B1687|nr:hypothetical protein [Massilia sp. Root1485]